MGCLMPVAGNIDEVLSVLDRIIAVYRARRSRLAFFPALYRAVTLRVRAGIQEGVFEDGRRMDRFDTVFANLYFAALDDIAAGRRPPRAWQAVFNAEDRRDTSILQYLLLGMNAHINFDLPIATASLAPADTLPALRSDFLEINRILAALLDRVQDIISQFSPLLDLLDRLGGRTDEIIVTFSLINARDEAWHEATRLAAEPEEQRKRSILSLDRRVVLLAERIIVPGGTLGLVLDLIARTENADVVAITEARV